VRAGTPREGCRPLRVRTPGVRVVSAPDDDRFIVSALALKAAYIVTGDKALLDVRHYEGIEVATPRGFLDVIGDATP
jgi:predicted nucleic acid-binding protein